MRIRADTLFVHDAHGRMLRTNEPDELPPPCLFLGHTAGGYVLRFDRSIPDELAQHLIELIGGQPGEGGLPIPVSVLTAVRQALEEHGRPAREWGGPAYRFPRSLPAVTEAVQITDANLDTVRDTFPWLVTELADWWPCFAVVRDGATVSICFSSRIGSDAAEAGVETLPDFRGRGYATVVTAAWGASIWESGRIPLYSTGWDNRASQGVARRLGLVMFGTDATWAKPDEPSS